MSDSIERARRQEPDTLIIMVQHYTSKIPEHTEYITSRCQNGMCVPWEATPVCLPLPHIFGSVGSLALPSHQCPRSADKKNYAEAIHVIQAPRVSETVKGMREFVRSF